MKSTSADCRLRVVVRAETKILRLGLAALIENIDHVVAESDRACAPADEIDVVVHAVSVHAARSIFVDSSSVLTKTIVILERGNPHGMEYLRAGVLGVLYADCEVEQLARAIDAVRNGDCYLSRDLGRALAGQLQQQTGAPDRRDPTRVLTERESQVAHLLAKGHPNRTIAQELAMSQATTKFHVSNILHKLKVRTRAQAASVLTRYAVGGTSPSVGKLRPHDIDEPCPDTSYSSNGQVGFSVRPVPWSPTQ